jgi:hypothetical protein
MNVHKLYDIISSKSVWNDMINNSGHTLTIVISLMYSQTMITLQALLMNNDLLVFTEELFKPRFCLLALVFFTGVAGILGY